MTKRKIILTALVCASIAVFAVQTQSETGGSNQTGKSSDAERPRDRSEQEAKEVEKFAERLRNMTPEQAIKAIKEQERERAKRHTQLQSERARRNRELANEGRGVITDPKQRARDLEERQAKLRKELKEFLREKAALGATEEQWKLIKPRLEKVRLLREQANSGVGLSLGGGSSDSQTNPRRSARPNIPTWQWKDPWKDRAPAELTEAQKIAKQLITLVEKKSVAMGTLRRTIDALRKARREEEAKLETQLSEARRELCEVLTTRQEAALVLMNSF